MEYLATYPGDQPGYPCEACGHCQASNFPVVRPSERIYTTVAHFLYEGATSADGYTTVFLAHGIHKLSTAQTRDLPPKIEAGQVLLLSQFHPDAPWLVSHAMERNLVVTDGPGANRPYPIA